MTNDTMARTKQTARKEMSKEAEESLTSNAAKPNDQMKTSKTQQEKK